MDKYNFLISSADATPVWNSTSLRQISGVELEEAAGACTHTSRVTTLLNTCADVDVAV